MRRHDMTKKITKTMTKTKTKTFWEHLPRAILETCDIWDTDYNSDNWEPEFMTIFVIWQLIVTLDSIRNSCDVFSTTTKSAWLTFSCRRSANYKVPPYIGGHHFLLCQQTNTKDIAGQSARSGGAWRSWNIWRRQFCASNDTNLCAQVPMQLWFGVVPLWHTGNLFE